MTLRKVTLLILILTLGFVSCKKDDSLDIVIELRDRAEQQATDKALLLDYLATHYYNSDFFDASNTDPNIKDLIITALAEGETVAPDGSTLLSDAVNLETKILEYADANYEYYILKLNQGGGAESPNFSDNVVVAYEGFTLDNEVFDSAVSPVNFDLLNLIPVWRKVIPQFNTAESFEELGDGTVNYLNHGMGVMFVPSGLAYFSSATTGISAYSPIIFKFELLKMSENDHDGDGVPSYKEDLNIDGEFIVNFADLTDTTDDDTDGDGTPDYVDADDDGDGIPTINEDLDGDGDPTNDIGAKGIPNYLDPDETDFKV
jgi:hypothetical protein